MISDQDLNELHLWSLARVGNLNTRRQIKELIDEVKELRAKVKLVPDGPNRLNEIIGALPDLPDCEEPIELSEDALKALSED